jgi:hypothetical protein
MPSTATRTRTRPRRPPLLTTPLARLARRLLGHLTEPPWTLQRELRDPDLAGWWVIASRAEACIVPGSDRCETEDEAIAAGLTTRTRVD